MSPQFAEIGRASRVARHRCRWVALAALLMVSSAASAIARSTLPPERAASPELRAQLEQVARDSTLAPWQREFMRGLVRGNAAPQSLAGAGVGTDGRSPAGISAYDGAWVSLTCPIDPLAGAAAVYDPSQDRMVVFGGASGPSLRNEVWALYFSGTPGWQLLDDGWGGEPSPRYGQTAIIDPVANAVVVFGGYDGSYRNDVWTLNLDPEYGDSWTLLTPTGSAPAARYQHTAVYDSARHRMLVFGGSNESGRRNDVWALTLSGTPAWSELTPTGSAPGTREQAAAIYDAPRDRMLVFGGNDAHARNDLWALSLAGNPAWSPVGVAGTPPSERVGHTAIYDAARDRVIVFGGWNGLTQYFNDVFALTLAGTPSWITLSPSGTPPAQRYLHCAVYDPARGHMVGFGGAGASGGFNDTWSMSLSGSPAWTQLAGGGGVPPDSRHMHSAIYDAPRERMVVFGGTDGYLAHYNDVWALSLGAGETWSQLAPTGAPPDFHYDAFDAVYDAPRERMVVLGPAGNGDNHTTAWALGLAGTATWSQLVTTGAPPSEQYRAWPAIYDAPRERIVLFGAGSTMNEVWTLSLAGTPEWSLLTPAGVRPHGRRDHTAIYDAPRERMVVFGGSYKDTMYNDVWALDLSEMPAWSPLMPMGMAPSARQGHTAIYDPLGERMVVFGGSLLDIPGQHVLNDAWALSLGGLPVWTQLAQTGGPPGARSGHTAIYDTARERMVVYGGYARYLSLDDTLALHFTPLAFTITATPGANGAIEPSGSVTVNLGSTQPFVIAPTPGYHVTDVLVDGVSVGPVTSYAFTDVAADHTIEASFAFNGLSASMQRPASFAAVGTARFAVIGLARIDSLTNLSGAAPGLQSEAGYGPPGSDPATSPSWQWMSATFDADAGGADQYTATLTVSTPGQYVYCFRYRYTPEASTWLYADLDGTANGYSPLLAGTLVVVGSPAPGTTQLGASLWSTDGEVHAVALSGNTLFIGGTFHGVWPHSGGGAPTDASTGALLSGFPKVHGKAYAVVADGSGGWFVGGAFDSVGGQQRHNIARVRSDLSVDSWNPDADGEVRALALSGSIVYAGGQFNSIGSQVRGGIAALDAATGIATSWDPQPDDAVYTLAVSGTTIYAGGRFSYVGGAPRTHLAALSSTTGLATSWDPAPDGVIVRALAVSTTVVYVSGDFTVIGGAARSQLAGISRTTGLATTWNPTTDGTVLTLALSGMTLYAGGAFTTIGGQPRIGLAALSTSTGLATSWSPGAIGMVQTAVVSGTTLYVGGTFISIGGQARNNVAALDRTTAAATAWNPNAGGQVDAIAVSGSAVYVGGEFTGIGGVSRAGIAAIDVTTGQATDWNPGSDGSIYALAVSGSALYAGGSFSNIGGQARSNIAALDLATGLATAWNPTASAPVNAIVPNGSIVYAGGVFGSIGGQTRNRIAAIDATTGQPTGWNPNAGGSGGAAVKALAVSGSIVYAGGAFTSIGGLTRNRIAAIDATTGLPTDWSPDADAAVSTLAVNGSVVYAGGAFTGIGGRARTAIAALDASSGQATEWNPAPTYLAAPSVLALTMNGVVVLAAGRFNGIGGQARSNIAALDPATGLALSWRPDANSDAYALVATGQNVYAGGGFTQVCGRSAQGVAAIQNCSFMGWGVLAGPATDTVSVSAPTDTIRGRVWIEGVTGTPGTLPDVVAQLGYGPDGSDPTSWPAGHWVSAAFTKDVGYDDEYAGRLTVASTGNYDFCFRYSWYGGPWLYADLDGTLNSYSPSQAGSLVVTGSTAVSESDTPRVLALRAMGNPFAGSARLQLALPRDGRVELAIFDIMGRRVRTVVDRPLAAGVHMLAWNARGSSGELVGPGVYLARLVVEGQGARHVKIVALR